MIKYKTPVFYYLVFILYIIISIGVLIFVLYDYILLLNEENLNIDKLVINETLITNEAEFFQNSSLTNISGVDINIKNLNIKNISSTKIITENYFTSDISAETINSNFLIYDDIFLDKQVETVNYYKTEYDFIYGYLCFSYYDYISTAYYNRLPTNFFSLYINKYPPAPSINKYNYFKFLDNSLSLKDFKFYDEIYQTDVDSSEYCKDKCYKSGAISYSGSTTKLPYLELNNIGGFIENIKVYNTMFYNQDKGSNKSGIFPTNKYLITKDLYGMKIPSIPGYNLLRNKLETTLYGQYASYNSVNFKITLNDQIINSDIDSNLIYYDNICPRTIIYDEFYGDDIDPIKRCDKLKYLKYTYNTPDQNLILTNSTELNVECNRSYSKSNVKYISLMTNSWYIVPSFIISFRINVVKNNTINFLGFNNCPK